MSFSPIDSILKVLTSCVHLMDKRFWLSRVGQSNSFSRFPTRFRSSHRLVYPFLSWVGTQISTSLSNLTPYSCHGFCDKVSECIFFGCGDNLDGDCRSSRKQRDRFGLRSLHTLLGSIVIKGEWIVSTPFSSPEISGTPVYSFLQLRLQTIYRGKRYCLLLLFFFTESQSRCLSTLLLSDLFWSYLILGHALGLNCAWWIIVSLFYSCLLSFDTICSFSVPPT